MTAFDEGTWGEGGGKWKYINLGWDYLLGTWDYGHPEGRVLGASVVASAW